MSPAVEGEAKYFEQPLIPENHFEPIDLKEKPGGKKG
jgi:hypothetical protein